ncbi:hypothetical protein JRQ81_012736 [Phrynocephalus forsythii]|uniref:Phospholipid/glycerol acyltransferase domain-containing protein n=1 Tax=Phrynocephalus forsythii TaxID=171643 RepID=A0A9Q0Y2E0_9SAUR|nr:hypothetical protein JRQ81_012736 [Phrynocephalus forsythii]
MAFLGYVIALMAYIYKKMNNVPEDIMSDSWHKLRQFLARVFIKWGKIMHDHEIIGMEHLPKGPGIVVFYHGTIDVDYVFLICNIYMQRRKMCVTVTDKWLINMPGMKPLMEVAGCIDGNKAECLEMLKKGYLLGVSPGGSRETIFSDQYYRLIWNKRTGFAQVALEAKVPIIPMFTQNIQEVFRGFGRTRKFGIPVFGSFPVKLRTYIGEPIPYDPDITAVELAEKGVGEEQFKGLLVRLQEKKFLVEACTCGMQKKINNVPEDILSNSWHKLRHSLAHYLMKLGKIINGYEIIGMEHLPEGPGIIVFYHGTINIDYVYFVCNLYLQKGRLCVSVTEKALFYIPGMKLAFDACACIRGSKAECVEVLKKGYLLGVAPGGGREAIFSDQYYRLVWGKRTGFAQVALEAKVPIIPMFTQNIQEAFRGYGRTRFMRWLYEKTRMLGIPIHGCFPVKLRTYIGEPIPYDPNTTAGELAQKTKVAIENLRDQYQKTPGNIFRAFSERFNKRAKEA